MFWQGKLPRRFSLLLLEENEFYVEDYVAAVHWPSNLSTGLSTISNRNMVLQGKIRLCSKSMFFEPDDKRVPILRFPFVYATSCQNVNQYEFIFATTQVTKMKTDGRDEPYIFEKDPNEFPFKFVFTYSQMDTFMPLAQTQLALSRYNQNEAERIMEEAARQKQKEIEFDASRLVDYQEIIQHIVQVELHTPFIKEPGKLVISDKRLYFQPIFIIQRDQPVKSHPIAAIATAIRRYQSLRPIGLEIFFLDPAWMLSSNYNEQDGDGQQAQLAQEVQPPYWEGLSAYFTFSTQEEREQTMDVIFKQSNLGKIITNQHMSPMNLGQIMEGKDPWLMRVTKAWQMHLISNFDYLLYLNIVSGRSFNNITQWPVFPWILRDYSSPRLNINDPQIYRDLSKPVGALDAQRLEHFVKRFKEMPEGEGLPPKFLYGTHYSTPGYVMYWLVRSNPGHMLRLQNGKFDSPDRLFCSVQESWESVLTSTSDVKELIPEFFMPYEDFLINRRHLPLGLRQTGKPVDNVELPPWADSPIDFLFKNRMAIESNYVSLNLNHWIDLIFGYKQCGEEAVKANNLFYYLSYEGAVDLSKMDETERRAIELQINEFGQIPRQLFQNPHPNRLTFKRARQLAEQDQNQNFLHLLVDEQHIQHLFQGVQNKTKFSPENNGQALSLGILSTITNALKDVDVDNVKLVQQQTRAFQGKIASRVSR